MRRTTIRSQRQAALSGRRSHRPGASRRRGRTPLIRAEPILTTRQLRELAGVGLLLFTLLGVVAMLARDAPGLAGLGAGLGHSFGAGWPIPLAATLAAGAFLIWPRSPGVPVLGLLAGLIAVGSLLGLMSLLAHAGGSVGAAISGVLGERVGAWGAGGVLAAGLVLGLIIALGFSPGAMLLAVATGLRAAYSERRRLDALVRKRPAMAPSPAEAAPSAAGAVPAAPPAPAFASGGVASRWDLDEDDEPEFRGFPAHARAEARPAVEQLARLVPSVIAEPDEPDIDWKLPPMSLLDTVTARRERMKDEIKRNAKTIETTLATFGVQARVIEVNPGPAVTQFEVQPAAGVQVKRITALQNDLSLALAAAPLRIEAPIPGKSAVGIEVPNKSASLVTVREVLETPAFRSGTHHLALAIGNDVSGQAILGDLTRMPHLLIAGATGQGKSVCINVLIASLLFQATPQNLRLLLIDPKRVELSGFNGLPHLAVPVIVEPHEAATALRWAVAEMDRRYKLLSAESVRNIVGYNEKAIAQSARPLPYVVIVIDELADLMMVAAGEIEELVCRIAQLARAVGIHLVIATQRPSTDIITGLIKANIPSRVAFAVPSQVDSRVILDSGGAEKLLGRGDMLYQPVDAGKPVRIQGAFISDTEVEALVGFWKAQGEPRFIEDVLEGRHAVAIDAPSSERRLDPLFARSARAVAAEGGASVSLVQRKFNVGYSRAGRIVDQLAEHRVVGGYQGSKSREVLMNLPDVDELLERLGLE